MKVLCGKHRDAHQTFKRLLADGVKRVVVKQGANGAWYQDLQLKEAIFVPSLSVTNVIDTTSAGDAFNAGFLAEELRLSTLKEGTNIASFNCKS